MLILRKDLTLEIRTGEVLTTSAFFALLVAVLCSMSFYTGPSTQAVVAAGVIWLSVAFCTVLALGSHLAARTRGGSPGRPPFVAGGPQRHLCRQGSGTGAVSATSSS